MKQYRCRVFAGLVVLAMAAAPASACDLCAIYRSLEARTGNPGPNLGVFEQFTHFGTMQQDGHKVDNPAGQRLDSSITQFIVGYRFDDNFGVQMNIPYINRSFRRPNPDGSIDTGTVSGVGDISLIGHYRGWQLTGEDAILVLDLMGGVKFPTGDSGRIGEELNETTPAPGVPESGIHGHDLALGSGSWDGVVGAAMFASWQRLFVNGAVQYSIRSRGDFNYRYANDLGWHVKPGGYLWLTDKAAFSLQLAVSGEDKGKDDLNGVVAEDTGMTSLFAGPEISYTWKEKLSVELGAEFPLVNDNTALQLVPDYRIKGAVTYRF
ncbi:hypothetical protein GMSM_19570 [Geomonas sp. Red276]